MSLIWSQRVKRSASSIDDPFKISVKLSDWLDSAIGGLVSSFVNGVERDLQPSKCNGITMVERTDGGITRLKLIKRQMYGRAKLSLLEARLVYKLNLQQQSESEPPPAEITTWSSKWLAPRALKAADRLADHAQMSYITAQGVFMSVTNR